MTTETLQIGASVNFPPKQNAQGDVVCDWCGYVIPYKRNVHRDWIRQDWISEKGTFCSKSHAQAGQNDITWRAI